jgi:hypothetical protein
MRIAIIDTGVEKTHEALKSCHAIDGITITQNQEATFEIMTHSFNDEVGHGTGVLGIICQHVSDLNVFVVKLKGFNDKFTEELLCEGIHHTLQVKDIKIINISMGVVTDAPSEKLRKLCLEAYSKGIFIVASAYSNTSKPCYPAYFENVFGVGKGYFMSEKRYQYTPENKTNILAKGTHQQIATLHNSFTFSNGTSYATAHFTGILYHILAEAKHKTIHSILPKIAQYSTKPIIEVPLNYTKTEEILSYERSHNQQFSFYSSVDSEVKKVALFPFNCHELRDIILNKKLFDKEIVLGIDFPDCIDTLNHEIAVVKRVPTQPELALFDSVVVSNITDTFGIDDFKLAILTTFIHHDKNIITWDYPMYCIIKQIIANQQHQYVGKVYFPYYSENFMRESYLNLSLPPSENIPSLPIIKMEENMEGFVYQYMLSNSLEKKGYHVSNITIDPHGILFGNIDIIFPFTTKRMVDLEWEKWGIFLRLAKRLIAYRKQPDIFISGIGNLFPTQGIEPHLDEHKENDLLKNTIFLKGIKPDAYIGVITSKDNLIHIEKTYTYLKNVLGIEPLFFVTQSPINAQNRFLKLSDKRKFNVLNIHDSKKIVKMIETKFSN